MPSLNASLIGPRTANFYHQRGARETSSSMCPCTRKVQSSAQQYQYAVFEFRLASHTIPVPELICVTEPINPCVPQSHSFEWKTGLSRSGSRLMEGKQSNRERQPRQTCEEVRLIQEDAGTARGIHVENQLSRRRRSRILSRRDLIYHSTGSRQDSAARSDGAEQSQR